MSDVNEAKVDKGRSDYGKASIRNYRRKGPGHGEPAFFDPENKRGKAIDQRRKEHKERRGVKGAKVPAYKVESLAGYSIGGEIKKGVKRHKDAVRKKKEREGKAVNYAMLAQEYVPEEGYDHMRDKALERGTWKEPERKNPPRKPQTDAEKKKSEENSKKALQTVKNNILKKYGKGAIWEPKTQKEGIEDIIARLEKKRISKGGNPDESPLGKKTGRAMKDQQDKARKKADVKEAKVDAGKSRTEKEKARNKRAGMDKTPAGALPRLHPNMDRRDDHEDKRGVKKVKGGKEKKSPLADLFGEAKVDAGKSPEEKEAARNYRKFGTKHNQAKTGALRRSLHNLKRGDKITKGEKNDWREGKEYGLYKGDGKAKGAMKDFLDKKAAKLKKEKDRQSAPYKNNPAFGDASHHSNAKNRTEGLKTWKKFLEEGNRTSRQLTKSKTQQTGNISADRGDDEKKNRESRKGLEKDLKKKGIGYSKGVGEYAYKSDGGKEGTKKEVSYQTSPGKGMSKRRFGKVMRRLGRKHGQESVITKDKNKPARLHDTQNKKADKSFALGKSKPGKNPSKQGETSGTKVRSGKLPSKTKGAMHYGN